MAGKLNPRYFGALNEPISPIIESSGGQRILMSKGYDRYLLSQWAAKLDLLLAHYQIEPKDRGCWRELAFRLALENVPGMRVIDQPVRRKGAPRKQNFSRDHQLVELIEKINHERKRGINDAIRTAQKRHQLTGNARSIRRRYYEAKKRLDKRDEIKNHSLPKVHQLTGIYPSLTTRGRSKVAVKLIREKDIVRFREFGLPIPDHLIEQIKSDANRALAMQFALLKSGTKQKQNT